MYLEKLRAHTSYLYYSEWQEPKEMMVLPYHLSKDASVIILYFSLFCSLNFFFTSHPFQPVPSKPNESQMGIPKIEEKKNPHNLSLLFALFVGYESLTEPLI